MQKENRMRRMSTKTAVVATLAGILVSGLAYGQDPRGFEVTVTNLTKEQIISPPVVASHKGNFSLFKPGQPASDELAALAEDAIVQPLVDLLLADDRVQNVVVGSGGIPPGTSLTIPIVASSPFNRISVAGMLVTTNDTFFAVRGLALPRGRNRVSSTRSPGYDSGSEENNELCSHIPGPPCGSGGIRSATSEGFVYVQSGIQGTGDLDPSELDWRNPVAEIVVRRVQ
jgi:hypothetical protein